MIALQARRSRRVERFALFGLRVAAGFVIFAMAALLLYLGFEGTKTFYADHVSVATFLFSPVFGIDDGKPGSAVFVVGSLAVTLFAIAVGGPFGVAVGIFLAEIAPHRMTSVLKPAIELMVGIPSVVYGWLGLTLLVPLIRTHTSSPSGFGLAAAGIVLSIMILPTVITLSEDAFRSLPAALKEGSLALGRDALADDHARAAAQRVERDRGRADPGDRARDRRDARDPDGDRQRDAASRKGCSRRPRR